MVQLYIYYGNRDSHSIAVFMVIKALNMAKRKKEEAPVAPAPEPVSTKEEILLTEIRDLLKK